MEQCEWFYFPGQRGRTRIESARGPGDRRVIPAFDPGQPRPRQYVDAARGACRGHMESLHEAGRLARIDTALLPACQSLRALHIGSHATYSFVTHQDRIEIACWCNMPGKSTDCT